MLVNKIMEKLTKNVGNNIIIRIHTQHKVVLVSSRAG